MSAIETEVWIDNWPPWADCVEKVALRAASANLLRDSNYNNPDINGLIVTIPAQIGSRLRILDFFNIG
jgi:hypothetical protein